MIRFRVVGPVDKFADGRLRIVGLDRQAGVLVPKVRQQTQHQHWVEGRPAVDRVVACQSSRSGFLVILPMQPDLSLKLKDILLTLTRRTLNTGPSAEDWDNRSATSRS